MLPAAPTRTRASTSRPCPPCRSRAPACGHAKSRGCPRSPWTVTAMRPCAAGAMSTASSPLRTGMAVASRIHSRYSAHSPLGIRSSAFQLVRAEARLVPRLIGEARHVEIGPGVILGAAQRAHARIGEPRALPAVLGLVDDEDVSDLGPHQREGDGEPALARADDQHVERRLAVRRQPRLEPGHARMRDAGEVPPHLGRESRNALLLRAGSMDPMRLLLQADQSSSQATARIGLPVPPLICNGKPMKRKRPLPTSLSRLTRPSMCVKPRSRHT